MHDAVRSASDHGFVATVEQNHRIGSFSLQGSSRRTSQRHVYSHSIVAGDEVFPSTILSTTACLRICSVTGDPGGGVGNSGSQTLLRPCPIVVNQLVAPVFRLPHFHNLLVGSRLAV
jgi:hypothetical protein